VAYLLFDDRKPSVRKIPNEQAIKSGDINDDELMSKLLENIVEIHIKEIKQDMPEFRIHFKY
jgi:hypothetical protein